MKDTPYQALKKKHSDLIRAHILATRHNVQHQDIVIEQQETIDSLREAIREYTSRNVYPEM
jgi:asparagine synthetase B (glutamine-hydrolysing)